MSSLTVACAASVAALLVVPSIAAAQGARPDTGSAARVADPRGVWGAVESADGTVIVGAVVRAAGTTGEAVSDSNGTYSLPALPAGIDTLHVARAGYEPLTLTVIVPVTGAMRVDLVLDENSAALAPVALEPVRIVRRELFAASAAGHQSLEPGGWEWDDDGAGGSSGVTGDMLGVLRASPGAGVRPDAERASLLGAGPGAPPIRVTVDGLPVWAPLHASGLLSVLTPELVDGLRLSDGTASARDGGAFSGTLDARTREETMQRAAWSGAISPVTMRAAWGTPLQIGGVSGHVLLATRHATTRTPSGLDAAGMLADPWSDAGGVLSLRQGRSSLEVVALASTDRLHARLGDVERATAADSGAGASAADVAGTLRAPWRTSTVGAVWTRRAANDARVETRAWRSDFAASFGGLLGGRGTAISDTARTVGVAADLVRGATRVGTSIEQVSTAYATTRSTTSGGTDSVTRRSALRASPAIVAAYAEHRWSDTARGRTAVVGLRASDVLGRAIGHSIGGAPLLEPHVALATTIARTARLTLGYARTHQIVQSVWSNEPVLSQIAPVALPVAARAGGAPVLTGDIVSAAVHAPVTSRLVLDVAAFGRDFRGMLVPAEGDAQASAVTTADGRSAGASIMARGDVAGLSWTASYRVAQTVSSAPLALGLGRRETSHDLALTLGRRVDRYTALHLDGWLGTPQRPGEDDAFGRAGRADADAAGETDVPTTPHDRVSAPAAPLFARAGAYSRLDLTLDRQWSLGRLGALDGVVTLANALGHANTAVVLPDLGETAQTIRFTPRSLLLGIAWRER